jgi:hypothetical protein
MSGSPFHAAFPPSFGRRNGHAWVALATARMTRPADAAQEWRQSDGGFEVHIDNAGQSSREHFLMTQLSDRLQPKGRAPGARKYGSCSDLRQFARGDRGWEKRQNCRIVSNRSPRLCKPVNADILKGINENWFDVLELSADSMLHITLICGFRRIVAPLAPSSPS